MAGVFLEPGDVGPADAAVVLAVLNQATSAEELAATIELPGEPDIGLRLAARILRRRDELGGSFADLAQVAAVPLIGPERFTDLVVALTGATAGEVAGQVPGDLRAELAALRAEVAALAAILRPVVPTLRVRSGGRWLGEPARLVAGVADRRPGVVLLVETAGGRLETTAGGTPVRGRAVQVTTGALGEAELTWVPDAATDLDAAQRAAVAARLPALGDAGVPEDARMALSALAMEYLREPARALREAVDVLWRARASGDAADPTSGAVLTWPSVDATVTVHALAGLLSGATAGETPAPEGTAVEGAAAIIGSAALVLRCRDWLAAFADALRQRIAATAALGSQLRTEAGRDADAATIGAAFQARLGSWVANRPGLLARELAVELAEAAARDQLVAAAEQRSVAEREALVPLLSTSARAVGAVPATVLSALEATSSVVRRDAVERIGKLPALDLTVVADLGLRLDRLAGEVQQRVTTDQLDRALAGKLDRAASSKIDDLLNRVSRLERQRPPR